MKCEDYIIEQLSCINFINKGEVIILEDSLNNKNFVINDFAYELFCMFDGKKSLRKIAALVESTYDVPYEVAIYDIETLYLFLKKNSLILRKKTFEYRVASLIQKIVNY